MLQPDIEKSYVVSDVPRRFTLPQPISETPQYLWIGPKTEIIIFLHKGTPRAFHSICPHMGAKMEKVDDTLRCPWHGLVFSADSLKSDHHRYKKICEVKIDAKGNEVVLL